jgi:hypothetical protein
MTRPIVTELNTTTQQLTTREMNDVEFAEHEARLAEIVAAEAEAATKATAKAELLTQLGITEEQAKLLLS